jgi:D-alanyl-lipoteichoic acid acyltransferase DltB (MBOAT superfamily)
MTFTTPTFLVFLIVVYLAYWTLARSRQNVLLLAASLLFYGWWDWRFLFLLLFTAGVDYGVAIALGDARRPGARRALILTSVVVNLGVLAVFKYFGFFLDSFGELGRAIGWPTEPIALQIVLPVGISFYTFQALSYTVDVYRGHLAPVRDPVQYLCFISFFPQLVAGPIERAERLLPQFGIDRRFHAQQSVDGLRQMLWGFFKKMVVADGLAPFVNTVYSGVAGESGGHLLWATYAFALQIYCDFSGYTDIAIGCARLFGFELMQNFDRPYFAASIPDFWRRWHISLSTWFRDYVYLPLGGSRVGPRRFAVNVLAVFGLSGLWHGANWTFVVWGLLHGAFYLASSEGRRGTAGAAPGAFGRAVRVAVTFNLVCLAWIFFRANSLADALVAVREIAGAIASGSIGTPPVPGPFLWAAVLLIAEWIQARKPHALHIPALARPLRWAVYYAVVASILLFANLDYTPFIYFQF